MRANFKAIDIINQYLFQELGYGTVANADNPDDLFLHTVMSHRKGYCLSLSILYLALAERIGLPLHGVVVPGHFFVRYDSRIRQRNIETTANGAEARDDHYIERHAVPIEKQSSIHLEVRRFSVDSVYASKELMYRQGPLAYQIDHYHEFVIEPGQMITEKARTWLMQSGLFARVLDPGTLSVPSHCLEGNVTALYGDFRDKSAPAAVVEQERERLANHKVNLKNLESQIRQMESLRS